MRCLFGAALCAGVVLLLRAQDFGPERTKGTVLLLKNGHAMTGEIEKVGSQMRVRNGASEVWIAGDKSARLCADWDDAFKFVQSLVKTDDANERVKLARWCHLHRLSDKALEQARKALELQPTNSDAKQLVTMLERALRKQAEERVEPAPVAAPKPIKKAEPVFTVDVTSETLIAFTTRVQPILMNACAACHTNGQGGKFTLERVGEVGSKAATQRNLALVLDFVDFDRPPISPLLERAIKPHGGEQAPAIRGRDSKAFQALHVWIEQTIAKNPQLKLYREVNRKAAGVAKTPLETPKVERLVQKDEPIRLQPELTPKSSPLPVAPPLEKPVQAAPAPKPPIAAPPAPEQPQSTTIETDPFDPTPFNRHFHSDRLKQR